MLRMAMFHDELAEFIEVQTHRIGLFGMLALQEWQHFRLHADEKVAQMVAEQKAGVFRRRQGEYFA